MSLKETFKQANMLEKIGIACAATLSTLGIVSATISADEARSALSMAAGAAFALQTISNINGTKNRIEKDALKAELDHYKSIAQSAEGPVSTNDL